jgi:hypothetical protein
MLGSLVVVQKRFFVGIPISLSTASQVHHRTLPLDLSMLQSAWKQQCFVERCGVTAQMVIEEFERSRVVVHCFNAWMQQKYPDEIASHEHGQLFLLIDPSPYTPQPWLQPGQCQYL